MSPREKVAKVMNLLNEADGRLALVQTLEHELSMDAAILSKVRYDLGQHIEVVRLSTVVD